MHKSQVFQEIELILQQSLTVLKTDVQLFDIINGKSYKQYIGKVVSLYYVSIISIRL